MTLTAWGTTRRPKEYKQVLSDVIVNLMHDYVLVLKKLGVPSKSTHRAIECVRDLASSLTRLFKVSRNSNSNRPRKGGLSVLRWSQHFMSCLGELASPGKQHESRPM